LTSLGLVRWPYDYTSANAHAYKLIGNE